MHWSKCQTKVLYLHGGAFCTCNSRTHRDLLHRLSLASQSAILAIDYRRPPEHPCPVAIDVGNKNTRTHALLLVVSQSRWEV
jgi:acetyl esterase/lipase